MSERPLPTNWGEFKQQNPSEALQMEQRDPELVGLLSGNCSANLKADALSGKFSPIAPDPQAIAEAQRRAEVEQLLAANPWGSAASYDAEGRYQEGTAPNLTAQLRLATLDPAKYQQLQQQYSPAPSAEQKRQLQVERAEFEAAARARSIQATFSGGGF